MNGLVVRPGVFNAFQSQREEELAGTIREDLQTNHLAAIRGLPPPKLDARIRAGLTKGKSYGIRKQYALATFVELMFLVGPDFDTYPPIALVLRRVDIPADQKVDVIVDNTTESQWQGARSRSDPKAWGD